MADECREVLDTVDRWLGNYNRKDLEGIRRFYSDDVMIIPPDEPSVTGWEIIRVRLQQYFNQGFCKVKHSHQEVKVHGNMAHYNSHYTYYNEKGDTMRSGKCLVVFLKDEKTGDWRITAIMFTKDQ